ncbi:MAG TPA: hypothetical protein VFJ71_13140 [Candidatus Limnocylindrales bacterium]|nr:hypothetical protein [Candidatus Limnocylindrales bacterium]
MSGSTPVHLDDEERRAADMASELEQLTMTTPILPSAGFADRVMAAVAREPLPQPVRAFGLAVFGGRLWAAASAVRDAGRIVTVPRVPLAVRAQGLALVLIVAVGGLALLGGAAVGAAALLQGQTYEPSPPVQLVSPSPSPSPAPSATPVPSATASPEASDTPEPTETADPTDDRTARPTAAGTDDHGGGGSDSGSGSGSGSGKSGSDSGGSGSGSDDGATETPVGTDDHGGSGG